MAGSVVKGLRPSSQVIVMCISHPFEIIGSCSLQNIFVCSCNQYVLILLCLLFCRLADAHHS